MRAGKLNKQISIRYPVSTARSTDGAPIITESTLLINIWAQVDPKTGSETYRDRNRWEVEETDFFIRYTTEITPEMSVRYDGNDYDIKAVINVGERNREIQLITKRHS
jgi:SPP1 family predicted phage head-tail adaptor